MKENESIEFRNKRWKQSNHWWEKEEREKGIGKERKGELKRMMGRGEKKQKKK